MVATTAATGETDTGMTIEFEGTLSKIKAAVGDGGRPPDDQYVADCVIGDERSVMWFPSDRSEPMGIRTDKYTADTAWVVQDDEAEVDGEVVDAIDVLGDGVRHRLDARKVKTVANALEMRGAELMELAEITTEASVYPVLFDLSDVEGHYGQVMIAPIYENESAEEATGTNGVGADDRGR